jgi:predicted nicotinamide N-methyase
MKSGAADLDVIEASLRRRFRVVETAVEAGNRTLSLIHPASADELIDALDFERDERLPYWAELWPSARVLGDALLRLAGGGRSLLELGCGAGLVATCAVFAGFSVTASDYYEDALRFTRINAWRNGARPPECRLLDWRHLPPALRTYDVVVASDVLYEPPYAAIVAGVFARTLRAGGMGLIADPGRVARDDFLREIAARGLCVSAPTEVPYVDGAVRQTISIFEITTPP